MKVLAGCTYWTTWGKVRIKVEEGGYVYDLCNTLCHILLAVGLVDCIAGWLIRAWHTQQQHWHILMSTEEHERIVWEWLLCKCAREGCIGVKRPPLAAPPVS